MKRCVKVVLVIIGVMLVILTALAVWQKNNISAVVNTITKTEEQIANELNTSKKQLETDIKEKYNANLVSDFTADEERKIISGEISAKEAMEILENKYEKNKSDEKLQNTGENNTNAAVDDLIGDKVIELYSLKAYYLGKLGQMETKVKKEYQALPKEKKNLIGKQEIVTKYLGTATSLLTQCDREVNKLLKELESGLKALNEDTAIIKTIRTAYEDEKALKKAYYLKLMGE